MKNGKLRVAVAGLRFGSCFVPIFAKHPDVYQVDVIEINDNTIKYFLDANPDIGVKEIYHSLEDALKEPEIDAVHLVTPIPLHAQQTLQVLRSGKHCACAVPAAVTIEELSEIVKAQKETGKNYMMMETSAYTYQLLLIEKMLKNGEIGRIQLMRGCHYQDMEGWPSYWKGLPPMHYATHAISPLLKLANTHAEEVVCFGSGTMREELQKQYGNPYPAETAIFKLAGSPVILEVTRTLFETAKIECEGFSVYGSEKSFEWTLGSDGVFGMFSGKNNSYGGKQVLREQVKEYPDTGDMLPPEISRFTRGGHSGSHPHLVHEFVRSIIENRLPAIDAVKSAQWTAAGLCAHISAMQHGAPVKVPDFLRSNHIAVNPA